MSQNWKSEKKKRKKKNVFKNLGWKINTVDRKYEVEEKQFMIFKRFVMHRVYFINSDKSNKSNSL